MPFNPVPDRFNQDCEDDQFAPCQVTIRLGFASIRVEERGGLSRSNLEEALYECLRGLSYRIDSKALLLAELVYHFSFDTVFECDVDDNEMADAKLRFVRAADDIVKAYKKKIDAIAQRDRVEADDERDDHD